MITFAKVSKKFGKLVVLDEVSFKVKPKEFVFLIGPTGAGKTTVVKLILRQYLPTTGAIKINNVDLKTLKSNQVVSLRRQVGVVFQDLKLLNDQTVFENVALPLKILGKEAKKIKKEVNNVLRLVGLKDQADFFPSQLAGGERQRAAIARAVIAKPPLIIADEPTGNLDPATSWQIMKLLLTINQQGRTVMVATHNFEVVNSLKKRVIELDHGRVVSDKKKGGYRIR